MSMTGFDGCQCSCHIPGLNVFHVVACCSESDMVKTADNSESSDLYDGQSPPDDHHFFVGGKDHCDSTIAFMKALGVEIACWHGEANTANVSNQPEEAE